MKDRIHEDFNIDQENNKFLSIAHTVNENMDKVDKSSISNLNSVDFLSTMYSTPSSIECHCESVTANSENDSEGKLKENSGNSPIQSILTFESESNNFDDIFNEVNSLGFLTKNAENLNQCDNSDYLRGKQNIDLSDTIGILSEKYIKNSTTGPEKNLKGNNSIFSECEDKMRENEEFEDVSGSSGYASGRECQTENGFDNHYMFRENGSRNKGDMEESPESTIEAYQNDLRRIRMIDKTEELKILYSAESSPIDIGRASNLPSYAGEMPNYELLKQISNVNENENGSSSSLKGIQNINNDSRLNELAKLVLGMTRQNLFSENRNTTASPSDSISEPKTTFSNNAIRYINDIAKQLNLSNSSKELTPEFVTNKSSLKKETNGVIYTNCLNGDYSSLNQENDGIQNDLDNPNDDADTNITQNFEDDAIKSCDNSNLSSVKFNPYAAEFVPMSALNKNFASVFPQSPMKSQLPSEKSGDGTLSGDEADRSLTKDTHETTSVLSDKFLRDEADAVIPMQKDGFIVSYQPMDEQQYSEVNTKPPLVLNIENQKPPIMITDEQETPENETGKNDSDAFAVWQKINSNGLMILPTDCTKVVECNGDLYAYGGRILPKGELTNDIYIYETTNGLNCWIKLAAEGTAPVAKSGVDAFSYNGNIYIFGGRGTDGTEGNYSYKYDPISHFWTKYEIPKNDLLIQKRQDYTAVVCDDSLCLFGGVLLLASTQKWVFHNDLWKLNLETNKWSRFQQNGSNIQQNGTVPQDNIPKGRAGHTAVVYSSSMWIFGGTNAQEELGDLFEFNSTTNEWEQVHSNGKPPSPRYGHAAVVISGRMIIFGGFGRKQSFLSDLYEFQFDTRTWQKIEYKGTVCPAPRFRMIYYVFDEHLYVLGGRGGTRRSVETSENQKIGTNTRITVFADAYKICLNRPFDSIKDTPIAHQASDEAENLGALPPSPPGALTSSLLDKQSSIVGQNSITSNALASQVKRYAEHVKQERDQLQSKLLSQEKAITQLCVQVADLTLKLEQSTQQIASRNNIIEQLQQRIQKQNQQVTDMKFAVMFFLQQSKNQINVVIQHQETIKEWQRQSQILKNQCEIKDKEILLLKQKLFGEQQSIINPGIPRVPISDISTASVAHTMPSNSYKFNPFATTPATGGSSTWNQILGMPTNGISNASSGPTSYRDKGSPNTSAVLASNNNTLNETTMPDMLKQASELLSLLQSGHIGQSRNQKNLGNSRSSVDSRGSSAEGSVSETDALNNLLRSLNAASIAAPSGTSTGNPATPIGPTMKSTVADMKGSTKDSNSLTGSLPCLFGINSNSVNNNSSEASLVSHKPTGPPPGFGLSPNSQKSSIDFSTLQNLINSSGNAANFPENSSNPTGSEENLTEITSEQTLSNKSSRIFPQDLVNLASGENMDDYEWNIPEGADQDSDEEMPAWA